MRKLLSAVLLAATATQQQAIQRAKQLAPEGVIHVKQLNGKFRKA